MKIRQDCVRNRTMAPPKRMLRDRQVPPPCRSTCWPRFLTAFGMTQAESYSDVFSLTAAHTFLCGEMAGKNPALHLLDYPAEIHSSHLNGRRSSG